MKNFRVVSFVAAATILVTTFQNCGKAGFESAQNQDLSSITSSTAPISPFAFDANFDQIMYNSCWGTSVTSKPGFFTLRAGAYSKYGAGITSDFITFAKSAASGVKPIYPASELSQLQIKQFLSGTTENYGAVPQMSLRSLTNYQTVYTPSGGAGIDGVDYTNMLGSLTDDRMMDPMATLTLNAMPTSTTHLATTPTTNYFPLMPEGQRNMDGSIRYNSSEDLAQNFRDLLNGVAVDGSGRPIAQGMLTLTYTLASGKGSPLSARSPGALADTKKVYGKGYKLRFEQIVGGNSLNPDNVLASVSEVNLIDGTAGGSWDCSRRYAVIKKSDYDANPSICPQDSFAAMGNQAYRNELEIVSRQLPPANWMVSIGGGPYGRCVVPRENTDGSCYQTETLPNGTAVGVEYNLGNRCYQGLPDLQQAYGSNPPTNRCLQFITICVRN